MGLFDSLIRNDRLERKEAMAAERRQMDFAEKQQMNNLADDTQADQVYIGEVHNRSDLIRWQQELDSDMYSLIMDFLSIRQSNDGKVEFVKDLNGKTIPPMCNSLFIQRVVIPALKPFMTKNILNSRFDDKTIRNMQRLTANDIYDNMADNYYDYEIDFSNMELIIRALKNTMRSSVWRAYQGWTKKTDSSMIKQHLIEQIGKGGGKQKLNLWGE